MRWFASYLLSTCCVLCCLWWPIQHRKCQKWRTLMGLIEKKKSFPAVLWQQEASLSCQLHPTVTLWCIHRVWVIYSTVWISFWWGRIVPLTFPLLLQMAFNCPRVRPPRQLLRLPSNKEKHQTCFTRLHTNTHTLYHSWLHVYTREAEPRSSSSFGMKRACV